MRNVRPTIAIRRTASMAPWFMVAALCCACVVGCGGSSEPAEGDGASDVNEDGSAVVSGDDVLRRPGPDDDAQATSAPLLLDITETVGIDSVSTSRAAESYFLPGMMGGGVAAFDVEPDGDIDLYLVHGHDGSGDASQHNQLWLQQSDGTFREGAVAAGVAHVGDGMGCAAADVDHDGDIDLYVTNYGPDVFYRNNGDGTFTDESTIAGVKTEGWSASAAFLDFDHDGWLDLYVTRYVELDESRVCADATGRPEYCGPDSYPSVHDVLYRNNGDGTFTDHSTASGIDRIARAGLGLGCVDVNNDGLVDIYVANDKQPNLLWVNRGDGTFRDEAMMRGAALNSHGQEEAGMGVGVGDADNDGDPDLFVTHFVGETNTYYENQSFRGFDDRSARAGVGQASLAYTGWGTSFFDIDLDGDLDLGIANGSVLRNSPPLRNDMGFWGDYAEPNLFFLNDGNGRLLLDTTETRALTESIEISRCLLPVDLDADGDLDVVVTNLMGATRIYRNTSDSADWIALHLRTRNNVREAVGATVRIVTSRGTFVRTCVPHSGYLSCGPASIVHGLKPDEVIERVEVLWIDGTTEVYDSVTRGAQTLVCGEGVSER